ncbi:transposase family protein [Deinococcus arcticus]|uniref:IS5 family transposase ISDge6 n=1 Tax=Deinococcus arcticus TaxID=2136176 RepID=A0A2T3W399_9DEIO|nr:transposase family protein [Deinococcus arcticus]PTA66309.1 IS5 family transposase ISDge6 [Deinococcus arcticus]
MRLEKLTSRARSFERLVGLSPTEFDHLLMDLEPLWEQAHKRALLRAGRVRRIGAGNTFKLDLSQRLLVTLLYLRQYFTMHVLGILFDLDAANVCRNIHSLLPVLEQALPAPLRPRTLQAQPDEVPGKNVKKPRKIRSLEELLEVFPELTDVVVDATEQPRGQPKVKKGQTPGRKAVGRPRDKKRFYSVKQGTHTLKVQLAVTPEGQIVHLSATARGRIHDMKVMRCSRLMTRRPKHVRVWGDRGYTGLEKVYPGREIIVPAKRPRKGQLSDEQRELNRLISKVRITAENGINRMKKFRACKAFFRNQTARHGVIWGCVAGLVNLRWQRRLYLSTH